MKLVPFWDSGDERPGRIDEQGRIRDLSSIIGDIGGGYLAPVSLARLKQISRDDLPLAPEGIRVGPCVAGYCVVNDVSERAFQLERAGQWMKGKSADSFGPIGP